MYILYSGGVTRALGPQMVLEEGDIPYELRIIDEFKQEHRSPEYLAMNPAGYIPTLVTPDGTVLHEAAAIMIYLAEEHNLTDLMPESGHPARGIFFSRLFYHTNDIQPAVRAFFKPEQYTTVPGEQKGIKDKAWETAIDRWSILDQYLGSDGPFHLGEQFSLLDLHMTLWAAYGLEKPDTVINRFPAIRRCFELTTARPKVAPLVVALQESMTRWDQQGED